MADEADDAVIQILRQIQAKLSEHDRNFVGLQEQMDDRFEHFQQHMDSRFERMQSQLDFRFDRVDRELTDLLDNTIKASGEASVSLVRHENVQRQFAEMELELRELRSRLRKLEEKV
jgi:site-specific recombinase